MVNAANGDIPIIDSHIHLFDTTRPQGVPYPKPDDQVMWKPATPQRYRGLAAPLGIVGAIEIEASPWLEDNLWVLEVSETDSIMVGTVGNLEPEKPDFADYLSRFQKNRLFRGIRCGNIWGRNLATSVSGPKFVEGIKLLSQADLSMDTANPNQELLDAVLILSDKVPALRIVIDHLPNALQKPMSSAQRKRLDSTLSELAQRKQIYFKVSEVIQKVKGETRTEPDYYRLLLDRMWQEFGEDRLMFGSDWPNWDSVASLDQIVNLMKLYVLPKGRLLAEKFFWRNSLQAYGWKPRNPAQPGV